MDQVPLPFVFVLDKTRDIKGIHGYVCFSQLGSGSENRFCSITLCLCQRGIQPNITVVFWGTGKGIVDFYKKSYKDDVILL